MRSWYSRLSAIVENTEQLVSTAEECARACLEGECGQGGAGGAGVVTKVPQSKLGLPLPSLSFPNQAVLSITILVFA